MYVLFCLIYHRFTLSVMYTVICDNVKYMIEVQLVHLHIFVYIGNFRKSIPIR